MFMSRSRKHSIISFDDFKSLLYSTERLSSDQVLLVSASLLHLDFTGNSSDIRDAVLKFHATYSGVGLNYSILCAISCI